MRIILNPVSRHGAGGRFRGTIERELSRRRVPFDLVETEGPLHGRELARQAARAGIDRIVAAGGDGTVHEVANGILDAGANGVALGILPIGTGNDFVKVVPGLSTRPAAFDALAGGRTGVMDVGRASWGGHSECFTNAMGTGIDVEVVRRMRHTRLLPGGMIYLSALIRALASFRPPPVEVDVDGTTIRRRIMNLAVCNGVTIGGSFRICPAARADDGLLDVCIINEMSMLRNARMVPRVLTGTHTGRSEVTMLRGSSIRLRLEDDRPLWFQLDGELREAPDGVEGVRIDVLPARLNVIRGASPDDDAATDE